MEDERSLSLCSKQEKCEFSAAFITYVIDVLKSAMTCSVEGRIGIKFWSLQCKKLNITCGENVSFKCLPSGHALICPEGRLLLIENLSKGIDLYDLPASSPVCTFPLLTKKRYTKDCVFAEGTSIIVGGSDHGLIYIFSMDHSEPIQMLKQSGTDIPIQALDVSVRWVAIKQH